MDGCSPRLVCCLCLTVEVTPMQTACPDCRAVMTLVDEQVPLEAEHPPRVVIGPFDV